MFFLFCSAQKGNELKVKSIRIQTPPISNTANSQQNQAGGKLANFFFLLFCDSSKLIKKKRELRLHQSQLWPEKEEKEKSMEFSFPCFMSSIHYSTQVGFLREEVNQKGKTDFYWLTTLQLCLQCILKI